MGVLDTEYNFHALSLRDLLEAREQFHDQLLNKPNVVGTAVGLYLIRNEAPWPSANKEVVENSGPKAPRTLFNSSTRNYSWPCLIVFVKKWIRPEEAGPHDLVDKRIDMSGGRRVPVCIVLAEPRDAFSTGRFDARWPDSKIGGGFPIYSKTQQQELVASVGCLVTNGHTLYALTSRHVTGDNGEPVFTRLRNEETNIGHATGTCLTRLPFNDVYPQLPPSLHSYVQLDVGLVKVNDANQWTSSTFGLAGVSSLADVNHMNLGTRLIDCEVRAYGAATGLLRGTVKGLFYRYKSIGGFDYVADVLIAPHKDAKQTQPGDSGTVWHLLMKDDEGNEVLRPFATEWGGQGFSSVAGTRNFSTATLLSNVFRLMDVDYVGEFNTALRPFWGKTGHYGIAHFAIDQVQSAGLQSLLKANANNISFDREILDTGNIDPHLNPDHFVQLADVPDVVWKKSPKTMVGGRDFTMQDRPEHPTHYADVDQLGANGATTLLEDCLADNGKVSVEYWKQFYDGVGALKQNERGLLPFRVWQFFDEMVHFVSKRQFDRFVAAAGILAHYVGDACQTLHGSQYSDGYRDQAEETTTSTGKPKKVWPGQGVHSAYEDEMVDRYAEKLFEAVENAMGQRALNAGINTGKEAAIRVVGLMHASQVRIPPKTLCDKYIALGSGKSAKVIDGLWEAFGSDTSECMADGAQLLADLWESAWNAGRGETATQLPDEIPQEELAAIYRDVTFVRSLDLNHIAEVLKEQPLE